MDPNANRFCEKCDRHTLHEIKDGCIACKTRKQTDVSSSMKKLRQALVLDEDYYNAWQSNIAMAFSDELSFHGFKLPSQHELCNEAANRFLGHLIMDNKS